MYTLRIHTLYVMGDHEGGDNIGLLTKFLTMYMYRLSHSLKFHGWVIILWFRKRKSIPNSLWQVTHRTFIHLRLDSGFISTYYGDISDIKSISKYVHFRYKINFEIRGK